MGTRAAPVSTLCNRILNFFPGPSLDANPVLWREWQRLSPSRWARAVWTLYGAMAFGLTATLIVLSARGSPAPRQIAAVANGFQAGIGLLLLSVSAATALAEERVRGNLDVLLSTPLSTRSIVWGKWCVAPFRSWQSALACWRALALDRGRWEAALLVVGLFLAYGVAVTSLGLALATLDPPARFRCRSQRGCAWYCDRRLVPRRHGRTGETNSCSRQPDHGNHVSDSGDVDLRGRSVVGGAHRLDPLDRHLRPHFGGSCPADAGNLQPLPGPHARISAADPSLSYND